MERRTFLATIGTGAAAAVVAPRLAFAGPAGAFGGTALATAIAAAERRSGGRLGVAVLDLATGARFDHRGDERFAMCSTFKFPLSGAVLAAADAGRLRLNRAVPVPRAPLPGNSPVVSKHKGSAMTVEQLCAATMTFSDNAAANLLLPLIGGVDGFNAFVARLGDRTTRLDRQEPELNTAIHGDDRDTTTPTAMLNTMRALLFGPALTPAARAKLTGWLVANTTGGTRLRAGLPRGWRVGDKTGSGENGTYNDVAVIWPGATRRPILVTCYLTGATVPQRAAHRIHADVGRAVAAATA
ncbi:class A beta-lactamase [Sphingomonas sp. Leaf33]|uniref:class A beta-lactamase n=1 Tax=Sphingomonas sp. Leaf33 TaxID=1736215 RepID=UPI0009EBCB6B|nr:class A beta-lactamase [Sphingomonas sp. Leaf33]